LTGALAIDVASATVTTITGGSTNGNTEWFVYGGNTCISFDEAASTSVFTTATDSVVQLIGVLDLAASSIDGDSLVTLDVDGA
jgi:hypothetical protein